MQELTQVARLVVHMIVKEEERRFQQTECEGACHAKLRGARQSQQDYQERCGRTWRRRMSSL
jgi:hypothetical protein